MTHYSPPKVLELLLQGLSLRDLENVHHVDHSICQVGKRHVSLNYNQFSSPPDNVVANQCRGLILANSNARGVFSQISSDMRWNTPVVCARPMDRFFNLGQPGCAGVDFTAPTTRVQEKLDGTLCILRRDPVTRDWEVGTRSVPLGQMPVDGHSNKTFAGLFWEAVLVTTGMTKDQFCRRLASALYPQENETTLCFELVTPYNQVLVRYQDWRVVLLSVRDTMSGQERMLGKNAISKLGVSRPEEFFPRTESDLVAWVNTRPYSEHEGVVVLDRLWNRVKVKSQDYVLGHRARFSASPRNLLDLVLREKADDVEGFLNDLQKGLLVETRALADAWIRHHDSEYQVVHALAGGDRKTFAMTAQARGTFLEPLIRRFVGTVPDTKGWINYLISKDLLSEVLLNKILAWKQDQAPTK